MRTSSKALVEVDSAAVKTLRAAIGTLTFCSARWIVASPNLLLLANRCLYVEYCDDLWFHDVFLVAGFRGFVNNPGPSGSILFSKCSWLLLQGI